MQERQNQKYKPKKYVREQIIEETPDDDLFIDVSPVITISPIITITNTVGDRDFRMTTAVPTSYEQQTVPGVSRSPEFSIDSGEFIKALGSIAKLVGNLVKDE